VDQNYIAPASALKKLKGTLFLCLLRKFFLLPTTPGISDLADFRKRKTLQLKKLQRFLVPIQF